MKQPIADVEKFRDNELKRIQEPKVLSPSEYGKLHENDIDYILDAPNKYKQYSDTMNQQVQSIRDQKAAYESSNAWKKGIS